MIASKPYAKMILFFILVVSLLLEAPSLVFGKPGVVIDVYRQAEVNTNEIRLDDISRVTGDDMGLVRKLKDIEIGSSPLPGQSYRIDEGRIRLRLKQFDVDEAQVSLNVPENAEVVRGGTQLSKERIQEAVLAYIRRSTSMENGKTRVKEIQVGKDILLPKGPVSLMVEAPKNRDLSGRVPIAVSISVGGTLEKKVWAVADIEVLKEVIVAKRPLGRYREITEDDVKVQEMDMAMLPSNTLTDYDDIFGKRTRKAIAVNTVLRSDMVEFPPLVKRGDVVTVVAESAGLRITALGIVKDREGRLGERILVENLDSKKGIHAQVLDPKTVRVEF